MKYSTAILLLVLLLLPACGEQIEPGSTPGSAPVIEGLSFHTVATSALPVGETFVGTVESSVRSTLAARIDGQVLSIKVKEGDQVERGQLLILLGNNTVAAQLRQAEAGLAQAEGGLAQAETQQKLAEQTYARYRQLYEKQAITPQEMDQITANLDVARKGLESARAAVELATSARDAARVAAGYSRVVAPCMGKVVSKQVEVGSTVMPGQPLLTLDRQSGWKVRSEIPEKLSGKIQLNTSLTVEIPTLGKSLRGTVSEVQPAANPQSRTFQVKIDLPNEEGLIAGLYARVIFSESGTAGILIPESALVTRGQLDAVFVREGDVLRLRMVRIGRKLGDQREILAGLKDGEVIVSAGAERAQNGARVKE